MMYREPVTVLCCVVPSAGVQVCRESQAPACVRGSRVQASGDGGTPPCSPPLPTTRHAPPPREGWPRCRWNTRHSASDGRQGVIPGQLRPAAVVATDTCGHHRGKTWCSGSIVHATRSGQATQGSWSGAAPWWRPCGQPWPRRWRRQQQQVRTRIVARQPLERRSITPAAVAQQLTHWYSPQRWRPAGWGSTTSACSSPSTCTPRRALVRRRCKACACSPPVPQRSQH